MVWAAGVAWPTMRDHETSDEAWGVRGVDHGGPLSDGSVGLEL